MAACHETDPRVLARLFPSLRLNAAGEDEEDRDHVSAGRPARRDSTSSSGDERFEVGILKEWTGDVSDDDDTRVTASAPIDAAAAAAADAPVEVVLPAYQSALNPECVLRVSVTQVRCRMHHTPMAPALRTRMSRFLVLSVFSVRTVRLCVCVCVCGICMCPLLHLRPHRPNHPTTTPFGRS
jgi:hypothetical protein